MKVSGLRINNMALELSDGLMEQNMKESMKMEWSMEMVNLFGPTLLLTREIYSKIISMEQER